MASIIKTEAGSFRVQVRRAGRKPITRTFKTRKEAEAFGRRVEADIDAGRAVSDLGGIAATVGQVITAYRELRETSPRPIGRQSTEHYMLRSLERNLAQDRVADLTPKRLASWARMRRQEGAGGYTIGMELSKLGTALRFASVSLGEHLPDVVAAARPLLTHLQLIGPGTERERRLVGDEESRLVAVAPAWLADVIRFALATAMRRGEIARIQWSDIDPDKRLVIIRDRKDPRRKAGNHQAIPLMRVGPHDAWAIVQAQPKAGPLIFPYSAERMSDTFRVCCDVAKIKGLHFHDLRHEATSRLFEAGLGIEQVALVTGHKNWRILQRYTQLRPESLHAIAAPTPASGRGSRQRPESQPTAARRRRT